MRHPVRLREPPNLRHSHVTAVTCERGDVGGGSRSLIAEGGGMALRLTAITLLVPWDDEDQDHPAGWGWDLLIGNEQTRLVEVLDFLDKEVN